ncbi:uncharacterized protein CLUP02_12922 [Colletotrichum lupini]|uniref:Uncharacterized protein n=1 Tax=Colletotrichum lupini TaxID=145971 RepID=A0A9Q8T1H2_9PEZI|nr:uncharacterized protein CLUP02_12922 [Colletotrichum lupini]UQC87417.1 hypothetical protein CLUP02_12922 [Colletotrichum lupini]
MAIWRSAKSERLLATRLPDQPRKSRERAVKLKPLLPPRLITGEFSGKNDETRRTDAKVFQSSKPTRTDQRCCPVDYGFLLMLRRWTVLQRTGVGRYDSERKKAREYDSGISPKT